MARKGEILAGEAYVALDLDDDQYQVAMAAAMKNLRRFDKESNRVVNATNRMSRAMVAAASRVQDFGRRVSTSVQYVSRLTSAVGTRLSGALFVAGAAASAMGASILAAVRPAAKAFASLEDVVSRFRIVFGDQARDSEVWARTFAKSIGFADSTILDIMGRFQALLTTQGVPAGLATTASRGLAELVPNIASFFEMRPDDVITRLFSGLVGEMEAVRRLGVDLSAQSVNQQLGFVGINPQTATQAQKAMARYNIIVAQTKVAHSDLQKTSNSLTNTVTRLNEAWKRIKETIGGAVAPALTSLASIAGGVLDRIQPIIASPNFQKVATSILAIGGGLTVVGAASVAIAPVITAVSSLTSAVVSAGAAMTGVMAGGVLAVTAGLAGMVRLLGSATSLLRRFDGSKLKKIGSFRLGLGGRGSAAAAPAGGIATAVPAGAPGAAAGGALIRATPRVRPAGAPRIAGPSGGGTGVGAPEIIDVPFQRVSTVSRVATGALNAMVKVVSTLSGRLVAAKIAWEGIKRALRPVTTLVSDAFGRLATAGKNVIGSVIGVSQAFFAASRVLGGAINRIIDLLVAGDTGGVVRVVSATFDFVKAVAAAGLRQVSRSFETLFAAISQGINELITAAQYFVAIITNPGKFLEAISQQEGRVGVERDARLEDVLARAAGVSSDNVKVAGRTFQITKNGESIRGGAPSSGFGSPFGTGAEGQRLASLFARERDRIEAEIRPRVARQIAEEFARERFGQAGSLGFSTEAFRQAITDGFRAVVDDPAVQEAGARLQAAVEAPTAPAAALAVPGANPQAVDLSELQQAVTEASQSIRAAASSAKSIAETASITDSSARSRFGSGANREAERRDMEKLRALQQLVKNTEKPGIQGVGL